MAATSSVSRIAAWVSGSSKLAKKASDAAAQRLGEDGEQRQDEEQHEEADRQRDQRPAHQPALAERRRQAWPYLRRLNAWIELMASRAAKEMTSITVAMAVAPA